MDDIDKQKRTETDKTEKKLSKKQRLFIVVLLRSKSITAACENFGGMNRGQFYEWRQQKVFSEALEAAVTDLVADALAELRLNVSGAADVLITLLKSRDENIQLRAANSLIEHYTRLIETRDLEARLEALEAAQKNV